MSEQKKAEATPPKRKMVRSPNSPSLSLSDALAKAKIIYDVEKKIPTTPDVMLSHIGYEKPDSGPAGRAFGALRQYGLVTEVEAGKFRISDSSFRYFELPPDDPERQKILREAALKPALFKELINRHKDGVLPSDAALRSYLVLEKNFNPNTVEDFIRVFRQTIAVAKPFDEGYTAPDAGEPEGESKPAGEARMQPSVANKTPTNTGSPAQFVQFRQLDGSPVEYEQKTEKRTELAFKLSRSSEARVVIYGEASQEAIKKLRALLELQEDTFPTSAELVSQEDIRAAMVTAAMEGYQAAIWRNKDHDQPVTITGELGEKDGRRFYAAKETSTGIPEDELEFQDAKAKGAA